MSNVSSTTEYRFLLSGVALRPSRAERDVRVIEDAELAMLFSTNKK